MATAETKWGSPLRRCIIVAETEAGAAFVVECGEHARIDTVTRVVDNGAWPPSTRRSWFVGATLTVTTGGDMRHTWVDDVGAAMQQIGRAGLDPAGA